MEWEQKLKAIANGVVVDKGVSVKYDGIKLPRFISEYLLSEFMQTRADHGSAVREMGIFVDTYVPKPGHASEWQYKLKSGDPCNIIDNISVAVNLEKKDQEPQVQVPSIGLSRAKIRPGILKSHPRLLRNGLWGKILLRAFDGEVWVEEFKPFQVSDVALEQYCDIRKEFSVHQWCEILISTIGLDPKSLPSERQRLTLISRLLPLVQGQTFLIEMGPPGTGKTFVLDKLSTRSFVVSGSKVSPASLFYNVQSKKDGLLRNYSALLLDEIDKVRDSEINDEVVNKLLKYMESGTFDRGVVELTSSTSLILVGNLPSGRYDRGPILRQLPAKLLHEAFLDRLNGIIPGWELPPVGQSETSLTSTWGFAADYFSEILENLRHYDWIPALRSRMDFSEASIRDEKAVMRNVAGLC